MLAGIDFITMGAGLPLEIPQVMRNIASGKEVIYKVYVDGVNIKSHTMRFHPESFFGGKLPPMKLPGFLPIVASNTLATKFMSLPVGSVQGLIIEEPTAGGHNAPPRTRVVGKGGKIVKDYGEKDVVDYAKIAELGVPFWLGGSYASPEKLKWALSVGATGIQVGSVFALSDDSGMNPEIRRVLRKLGFEGRLKIRTDFDVSPTGFPFKVVDLLGTVADRKFYKQRQRICDQGALVSLYEKPDGSIGYRCPSEPVLNYINKGGKLEDTVGRGCICNGLIANTVLGNPGERAVITLGDDIGFLHHLMVKSNSSYSAVDALKYLLSQSR